MPSQLRSIIGTIRKKPTKTADGRPEEPAAVRKTSLIHDVTHLGAKNTRTMAQALTTLASGEPMNDKDLLLENGVSMLQGMPVNSGLSEKISNGFIGMLWDDLPHPTVTLAGPESRYRRADGGGNCPWDPEMGKAGTPYSRSVPPSKPKGPGLPNVEDVFEALLKRESDGPFRKHPSGLNRLFFSFATVVIHECFQTNREKPWINNTSSYVDLSTIYGNNAEEQTRVRTYECGRIFPDTIASDRIMMMPPGVVAVAMLFSRNHNTIVESLYSVNEDGKYKPWEELDEAGKKLQDEDLFQLGRNINVGFFASVVLRDYVAAILNTPRANSDWTLDLGKEFKEGNKRVQRGTGNVVSVEFAVLYHWHAALSAADAKWMEDVIYSVFPNIDLHDVDVPKFLQVVKKYAHDLVSKDAKEWTFGGLQRGPDGKFKDHELAEIIKSCIEEPAHEFGAHGTPLSLKVVDLMGQIQAREQFNCCTLNEFRAYLNLKTYDSFEEWNSNPQVSRAAELLYGNINNLELYPGLMAECTKPAMPGSGVCPGQTTGRGILNDAVSLVRGDRFLSYDFNSTTLTQWGAAKLQNARVAGAYGGVLPNLLFSGLPGAFTGTSTYALLPFYTPEAVKGILKDNKVLAKYDTSRPPSDMDVVSVQTASGCKAVLGDRDSFRTIYQTAIRNTTDGHDFMIGWDDEKRHDTRAALLSKAFYESGFEKNVSTFFGEHVKKLIEQNSLHFTKGRSSIDIVRDVANITPILWLAERFAIPLKTREQPKGLLTIYQTFTAYMVIFMYQNFNIIPGNVWKLRDAASAAAAPLRGIFDVHLKTQANGVKEKVVDWLEKGSAFEVGPVADRLYHALRDTGLPIPDLVSDCVNLGAPVAGLITQQASLLIDLFLSPEYATYKARIVELAHMPEADSEKELQGFVFEGMRHAGVVPGIPRVATRDVTVDDGVRGPIHIKAGRTVLVGTSKASMDPTAYPDPEKLDPHRSLDDSVLLGHGLHTCFGARMIGAALAATLRQVFRLKNVRRAPGKQGKFLIVESQLAGITLRRYLDANSHESSIPTSLMLEYDTL